jgi:hypothetical protein
MRAGHQALPVHAGGQALLTVHRPQAAHPFTLSKAVEAWTTRQSRHLSYVGEFTSNIRHIRGVDNMVADTLSSPPISEVNAVSFKGFNLGAVTFPFKSNGLKSNSSL